MRPEVRVLTAEFLPPQEHSTFIWDGEQTLKVFKGSGAISFRLKTSVFLEPGTYLFVIRVFPDLVDAYLGDGQKVWAPDPLSGEVAVIVQGVQQPWQFPRFGQKNEYRQQITVDGRAWSSWVQRCAAGGRSPTMAGFWTIGRSTRCRRRNPTVAERV